MVDTKKLGPEPDEKIPNQDRFIQPRRKKYPWFSKITLVALILICYNLVYYSFFKGVPVSRAMPDTYYYTNSSTNACSNCWRMDTTDPGSLNRTTQVSYAATNYFEFHPGVTVSSGSASAPANITGYGWDTATNDLLSGSFPAGTWTVRFNAWSVGGSGDTCYIATRVWKADSSCGSASDISGGWQEKITTDVCAGSAVTTKDSITYNPGAVTLSSQVLYVEFYLHVTNAGGAGIIQFGANQGSENTYMETPTYEPIPENSLLLILGIPFVPILAKKLLIKKRGEIVEE